MTFVGVVSDSWPVNSPCGWSATHTSVAMLMTEPVSSGGGGVHAALTPARQRARASASRGTVASWDERMAATCSLFHCLCVRALLCAGLCEYGVFRVSGV